MTVLINPRLHEVRGFVSLPAGTPPAQFAERAREEVIRESDRLVAHLAARLRLTPEAIMERASFGNFPVRTPDHGTGFVVIVNYEQEEQHP